MKPINILFAFTVFLTAISFSQNRAFLIHNRGMLQQTVFNTGELGRAYNNGASGPSSAILGQPSFEWPSNSSVFVDRRQYVGQYNSFGGGLYIHANVGWGASAPTRPVYSMCGAVSDANGNAMSVEGVYSWPISLVPIENYPVSSTGELNPAYNPNEADQIIIAKWATSTGITVTRTSRAWSHPDYDDFIIYEYELENTGERRDGLDTPPAVVDTLFDVIVAWGYGLGASMFGAERKYNEWLENDFRTSDQFGRFDLKRWMWYNHDRDGKPDPLYFNTWAAEGKYGGGLNSPQAVGNVLLYYDYNRLSLRPRSRAYNPTEYVSRVWDANNKLKQPYIMRYENGNLSDAKIMVGNAGFLNAPYIRKVGPYRTSQDSTVFGTYWIGRGRPDWVLQTDQPVSHVYGFGPFTLGPNDKMRIVIAEVAGFGPGVGSDSVYYDHGGGYARTGGVYEPSPGIHPVCSWYNKLRYDYLNTTNGTQDPPGSGQYSIGSDYLQTYPLPSYVNSNVISIRDVADRAIQAYTGWPLIKWDSVSIPGQPFQAFDPYYTEVPGTGFVPSQGAYNTVAILQPAPIFRIEDTKAGLNKLIWGPQVEGFDSLIQQNYPLSLTRLAGFSHYEVLRQDHPLSKITLLDSIGIRDPRYFKDTVYVYYDLTSFIGSGYYYSIVTVDSLGRRSGMTNRSYHLTNGPAVQKLGKVYAVPNPLFISSRFSGGTQAGDINDKIGIFGLPKKARIRIFSYSGQLITTLNHEADQITMEWFQITRNNQRLASGVYYFTVEDLDTGDRAWNKFVVIH